MALQHAVHQPAAPYGYSEYGNYSLTMKGYGGLAGLQRQIEDIIDRDIEGDIYETGTWRGGTAAFMVGVVHAYESLKHRHPARIRQFWFFDSFAGFDPSAVCLLPPTRRQ